MKIEIQTNEDETFKLSSPNPNIQVRQFGEVYAASDGEHVSIAVNEETAVIEVENMQFISQNLKVPAPIESPKGLGWFDGTSWGR